MKVVIPLPAITATWVQVPVGDSDYAASWDLKADSIPESLCHIMGFSTSFDGRLIAWIDQINQQKDGREGFVVCCPGPHGDASTPGWSRLYSTLEEAQAAVHEALDSSAVRAVPMGGKEHH